MAKARVTPLKSVTIPRLELGAAVLSARISSMLVKELQYQDIKPFFWTDSKVVLGYIGNVSKRFDVFVANRVQEIRDRTDPDQWQYVSTEHNPADAASRGMTVKELKSSSWFRGPSFLWQEPIPSGPGASAEHHVSDSDPEVKRVFVQSTRSEPAQKSLLQYLERYSSWNTMKRTVALCMKVKDKLRELVSTGEKISSELSVNDLRTAETTIIKLLQEEAFPEEIESLKLGKPVKSSSPLRKLDPFVKDGLLRVGGRIRHGDIPYDVKHPVILPKDCHISQFIVRHYHEHVAHQGKNLTTNEVRTNGYWILGLSRASAKVVSECVTCRRLRGQVQEQKMADLPRDRLEAGPPFTNCGVDYFGPWVVKEGRREVKRYGALFTCLSSRAVHIETAASLDSSSFINALRRFISIRGDIRCLRSDHGTNFKGAHRELREALEQMDNKAIKKFLSSHQCDYVLNPPSASHMGGAWERQIRSVRSILSTLLHQTGQQLDDEMLRTIMCEVTAIINSRPLTVENLNDPTAPCPLSPQNILTMKSEVILPPPGDFVKEDVYCRRRWRRAQYVLNEFWHRWR